ncbi:MAG: universal stress protein [Polyangiales bacterium]
MSLIPRLVVAYDFSDPARRAFELGVFMGRQLGADVHVVSVLDPEEAKKKGGSAEPLKGLQTLLHMQTGATIKSDDVHIECHAVEGEAADAIIDVARRIDAPMILCGTTGKGAVARTLLGSVSHELVQRSGAIVMSVP